MRPSVGAWLVSRGMTLTGRVTHDGRYTAVPCVAEVAARVPFYRAADDNQRPVGSSRADATASSRVHRPALGPDHPWVRHGAPMIRRLDRLGPAHRHSRGWAGAPPAQAHHRARIKHALAIGHASPAEAAADKHSERPVQPPATCAPTRHHGAGRRPRPFGSVTGPNGR
jgi:hypothetical protein